MRARPAFAKLASLAPGIRKVRHAPVNNPDRRTQNNPGGHHGRHRSGNRARVLHRQGAAAFRVAHDRPGPHQRVRRRHPRPPVHSPRCREGRADALRHDDCARLPLALAAALLQRAVRHRARQPRHGHQLRQRQGAFPAARARRQPRALPHGAGRGHGKVAGPVSLQEQRHGRDRGRGQARPHCRGALAVHHAPGRLTPRATQTSQAQTGKNS